MKEQQKKQQEEARREAAKKLAAEDKKNHPVESGGRRSTRTGSKQQDQDSVPDPKTAEPETKHTKLPSRGRSKGTSKGSSISNYFKKAEVEMPEDEPSVQEALAQAADEYEANPSALGDQDLVATQQPALITGGTMRQYQLEGLEWLKSLWMNGLCGILADEMGLGKTIQAISIIAFLKEKNVSGPFLVVCPLSTVANWVNEFARWAPSIKTVLYHGSKAERSELRREHMNIKDQKEMDFPVVCTSYDISMNDRKFLAHYEWRYIIVVSLTEKLRYCALLRV